MTEWGLLSWEGVGRGTVHWWRVVARQTGIQDKCDVLLKEDILVLIAATSRTQLNKTS